REECFVGGGGVEGVFVIVGEDESGGLEGGAGGFGTGAEGAGGGEEAGEGGGGGGGVGGGLGGFHPVEPAMGELLIGHGADGVGVEAEELAAVELGAAAVDALEGEAVADEGEVELLEVLAIGGLHAGIPAEEGDEVQDRFGEVAAAA